MITHIACFRWKPETAPAQVDAIGTALKTLPGLVPSIATYRFGRDLAIGATTNMDFAIVATFATFEDWRLYDEDPEHSRVRTEVIRPWVAERVSIQFES